MRYTALLTIILMFVTVKSLAFDYYQPLPAVPEAPADNPQTPGKIKLGRQLFFDARLSASGRINCNHCHQMTLSGADGLQKSVGDSGKETKRSTPTLWNVAYQTVLFWDGRATSLELAIAEHLLDRDIMGNGSEQSIGNRLQSIPGYRNAFKREFDDKITLPTLSKAIASYIRTLIRHDSPFDRYMRGDKSALSERAKQGMELFREVECLACHFGVNFAGPAPGPALKMGDGFYELFPNNRGTSYEKTLGIARDKGRFHFSKNPNDKHLWRVPPLRNIAISAPYFHNGSAKTLQQAIRVMAKTQLDRKLTAQQVELIAEFLNSLTGEAPGQPLPQLPVTRYRTFDKK